MIRIFHILLELISKELEKELRSVYVCTCELLKHFWRSFPPTTPQLEDKVIRMHTALRNFQSVRLEPFEVSKRFFPLKQNLGINTL